MTPTGVGSALPHTHPDVFVKTEMSRLEEIYTSVTPLQAKLSEDIYKKDPPPLFASRLSLLLLPTAPSTPSKARSLVGGRGGSKDMLSLRLRGTRVIKDATPMCRRNGQM